MLNTLFALLQAVATPNGEPQFTLGNVITIVVVILTGAAVVLRNDGRLKALGDIMEKHTEDDKESFGEIRNMLRIHESDEDRHLGKRLFDELIRRLDAQDRDRDRMEQKLDAVIKQTK